MRNCFVPNCDAVSKTKRMMFLPPKNNEMYDKWKNILPQKRLFKRHDRVCERHFLPKDISTTWDHIINGKIHKLERVKPKLNPEALPILNLLPEENKSYAEKTTERDLKKIHNRKKIFTINSEQLQLNQIDSNISAVEVDAVQQLNESDDRIESIEIMEMLNAEDDIAINIIEEQQTVVLNTNVMSYSSNETDNISKANDENNTMADKVNVNVNQIDDSTCFESIYDDIFEVTLPNTLWGIHRDLNRKFIIFSYFDPETMSISKLFKIDRDQNVTTTILKSDLELELVRNLSVEYISNSLSKLDEYKICNNIYKKNSRHCQLIACETFNYCSNCMLTMTDGD